MAAKKLSAEKAEELLNVLLERFEKNIDRHKTIRWDEVREKLTGSPEKLWSLGEMERTGGEPDVIDLDGEKGTIFFIDCSAESPSGRRNVCYDRKALESRKANKPETSALDMAEAMGIDILTEEEYRKLQEVGEFDKKTSSWVKTPDRIRKLGGAIFCDRRYDTVFTYHSGAESYYGVRGFRGLVRV